MFSMQEELKIHRQRGQKNESGSITVKESQKRIMWETEKNEIMCWETH